MVANLAAAITRAGSIQSYYTIRFLADRERVDDAFRAYAYFRWVDDVLDAQAGSRAERMAFLERQKWLLQACYRGDAPRLVDAQEAILIELVQSDPEKESGLQAYLHYMLRVMDFDVARRGRLISQAELNDYTRWLAIAVTEATHYFIGHSQSAPRHPARYAAVSGAHIAHMLRDTYADLGSGYYNVPREVLQAHHLEPDDVHSPAYRAWVQGRVRLAREHFQAGRGYCARVPCARWRLAASAYTARFVWVLDTLEREDYRLRPEYGERKSLGAGLRMSWLTLAALVNLRGAQPLARPAVTHPLGKL
jgi:hypothetical protein